MLHKEEKTKSGIIVIESCCQVVRGILELHGLEDQFKREANSPPFMIWWLGAK